MEKTSFMKFMNKDYLGEWDIPEREDLILTIKKVDETEVQNKDGKKAKKMTVHFEGDYKPMICNITNAKAIKKALGSQYIEDWAGKRIALYKATISAFGETVDAVRVRDYAPKEEYWCTECGMLITASSGMSPRQIAAYTKKQYGEPLCAECAKARKEKTNATE